MRRRANALSRKTSLLISAALVALLLAGALTQAWVLPAAVERVVAVFPEVKPLAVPAIAWGILAIACWQAPAGIGVWLVLRARHHGFDKLSYDWLRVAVGCLLAFIALVVSAVAALSGLGYATPGVMFGLIAGGLVVLIAAGGLVLVLGDRPAVLRMPHH
ncbi:small-conductance mechanosensitive channel [Arthrobacter sp. MP_2.3]